MSKVLGTGATFTWNAQTYAIRSIGPPVLAVSSVDASEINGADPQWPRAVPGMYESAQLELTVYFTNGMAWPTIGETQPCVLTIPTTPARTISFDGFIMSCKPITSGNELVQLEIVVKIAGKVTLA